MSFRNLRNASTRFVAQYSIHSNYFLSNKWRSDKEVHNIKHAINAHTAPTQNPKALELMGVKPKKSMDESPASSNAEGQGHYGPNETPSNVPQLSSFPTTESVEIVIQQTLPTLTEVGSGSASHESHDDHHGHLIPVSAPVTPRGRNKRNKRKHSVAKQIGKVSVSPRNTLKLLPIRSISNPFQDHNTDRMDQDPEIDMNPDDTLPSNKPQFIGFIHHQSHSTTDLEKYKKAKKAKNQRGLSAPKEFRLDTDNHETKKSKHASKISQSQHLLNDDGHSNHLKPINGNNDIKQISSSSLRIKVSSFMDKFRKSNKNLSPQSEVVTDKKDKKALVRENFADAAPFRISISGKDNDKYIKDLFAVDIGMDLDDMPRFDNLCSLSDPIAVSQRNKNNHIHAKINLMHKSHRHSSSTSLNQKAKEMCLSADDVDETWIDARLYES